MRNSDVDSPSKLEWGVALGLSLTIVYAHSIVFQSAGGLWRDEANTAEMAKMPLAEMWSNLSFESFPALWILILRGWMSLGLGGTDEGLRLLGMLVGLGILGVLWFSAHQLGRSIPLFSLLLFGWSPVALRYGDSVRAYGMGVILIVLTLVVIWQLVQAPTSRRFVLAAVVAVLSVQSLYQNAVLLAAICAGAVVVALRGRRWKASLPVVAVGGLAAASLLAYLGPARRARLSIDTSYLPVGLESAMKNLAMALSTPSPFMLWLWLGALIVGIICVRRAHHRSSSAAESPEQRDLALYAVTTAGTSLLLSFYFLKIYSFQIYPWHFIVVMAVLGVCLDSAFASAATSRRMRTGLAVAVAVAGLLLILSLGEYLRVRQTNIDLVAARLNHAAGKNDLIVVSQWYGGISFQRYYHGAAPWTTLPPISDLRVHRTDLLKQVMGTPDPIASVLERMGQTLQSGGRVWLVLTHPILTDRRRPRPPPPPPHPISGWYSTPYLESWGFQAGDYLQTHGVRLEELKVPVATPVNPLEKVTLQFVEGWKARSE